jgi:hypothetical protein
MTTGARSSGWPKPKFPKAPRLSAFHPLISLVILFVWYCYVILWASFWVTLYAVIGLVLLIGLVATQIAKSSERRKVAKAEHSARQAQAIHQSQRGSLSPEKRRFDIAGRQKVEHAAAGPQSARTERMREGTAKRQPALVAKRRVPQAPRWPGQAGEHAQSIPPPSSARPPWEVELEKRVEAARPRWEREVHRRKGRHPGAPLWPTDQRGGAAAST